MNADQVVQVVKLYAAGRSSAAIGRTLGFDNKVVLKELRAAGVTIRQRSGR